MNDTVPLGFVGQIGNQALLISHFLNFPRHASDIDDIAIDHNQPIFGYGFRFFFHL